MHVTLANMTATELQSVASKLDSKELTALLYQWPQWARAKQLAPDGDWFVWLLLAGRGYGKSRAGAEWFRAKAESTPNGEGVLVAQTPGDARDVMIMGRSGLLNVCPPWNRPVYEPSNLRLVWPNGYVAHIRSSHNPERVRGLSAEHAWADELAAWPIKAGRETWDNLMLSLREGRAPQVCVTTTPKPTPLIRELVRNESSAVTRGSTYENADNLAESYLEEIRARYEGTTLGRQELHAEILDEVEGALWKHSLIEKYRVEAAPAQLSRIVIGVDPSGGVVDTGVVVAGLASDGHVYVMNDATVRDTPDKWGGVVVSEYIKHKADVVAGEKNFGGDMVAHVIRTAADSRGEVVRYKDVLASRGKVIRAEPVVALYEQRRVHHVGTFPDLEAEMTRWVPGEASPNRIDALVWSITELAITTAKPVTTVRLSM